MNTGSRSVAPVESAPEATAEAMGATRKETVKGAVQPVDVVLISMPFGVLEEPAIALGLLKASLGQGPSSPTCKVLYFTLRFAQRIDPDLYRWIATESRPINKFIGERLFRSAAFGRDPWPDDGGWESWVDPSKARHVEPPEDVHGQLDRVRAEVDPFLDDCLQEVLALRPKVVGFTSVFQQQLPSLALARRLKEADPSLFVVFGGANCEGPMGREMVRQFDFLDATVSGEGEVVFPQLVDRVLRGERVDDLQGVSSAVDREGPARDITHGPKVGHMDALPVPDYSDFFEAWASSRVQESRDPQLPFETSRGCWWGEKEHCTFCGLNGSGMAFRSKSDRRALTELETLLDTYPVPRVQVVDNILDMRYFKGFIPSLAEKDWDIELFYEVKANLSKPHLMQLKAAGITSIQPGIESLSTPILEAMGKGVSMLQNIRLLKWCQEIGIYPVWNMIWGFPEETPEQYRQMADLIPWLSHLAPPFAEGRLRIDRFSPNYERSGHYGFVNLRPDAGYGRLYPVDAEALSNLAYYFDFEYGDGRDVASYAEPTYQAVLEWRRVHSPGALSYLEKEAGLLLLDRRPAAKSSMAIFHGADRLLYEACDDIKGLRRLVRLLENAGFDWGLEEVEAKLQSWVEAGLMVHEGDNYLSLAVQEQWEDEDLDEDLDDI